MQPTPSECHFLSVAVPARFPRWSFEFFAPRTSRALLDRQEQASALLLPMRWCTRDALLDVLAAEPARRGLDAREPLRVVIASSPLQRDWFGVYMSGTRQKPSPLQPPPLPPPAPPVTSSLF
jgi:hypothetical protein